MDSRKARKMKSKLLRSLDVRLPALIEDLNLMTRPFDALGIRDSSRRDSLHPVLAVWLAVKASESNSDVFKLARALEELVTANPKPVFLDRVKSKFLKNGTRVFWVEKHDKMAFANRMMKATKPYYTERVFYPFDMVRGMPQWAKRVLLDALANNLIPVKEEHALPYTKIKAELENHQRSQNPYDRAALQRIDEAIRGWQKRTKPKP